MLTCPPWHGPREQWAATRRDLFPPDLCSELERLHTQAPSHSLPFTEAAIEAAFGFGVPELFSWLEPEPLASGSIGQIHRAALAGAGARLTGMPEGSVVAVKVRHPGVSAAIERDFRLMVAAARLAAALPALGGARLEESLKQFAAPLREQVRCVVRAQGGRLARGASLPASLHLTNRPAFGSCASFSLAHARRCACCRQVDLSREATHLHQFNYNFRKLRGVTFPVPLYPLVAPSVLVESFESGDLISEYVAR